MAKRKSRGTRPSDVEPPAQRGFSWFPGHMLKAQRRLREELKGVDAILEVRDARLPRLSANPELTDLLAGRPRLVLLNKARLADPEQSRRWTAYFERYEQPHLFIDADTGDGLKHIVPILARLTAPLRQRYERRGIRPPLPRLMVVGFPNVGKTTLINRLVGRKRLATAPEPGVTRGITWVTLKNRFELMDSPGVMLPRLDDEDTILRLGWIGTLRDHLVGEERLARGLLRFLLAVAPQGLTERYGIDPADGPDAGTMLQAVAQRRSMRRESGEPDLYVASVAVLQDFRGGRLGRVTLEFVEGLAGGAG